MLTHVSDTFNLQRFLDAQAPIFDQVVAELRDGSKQSHWMWFVFPQLAGLGRSATALYYALASLAEAEAYLAHAVLGPRLRQTTELMLGWAGRRSAEQILGPIDAMKLHSSMTVFDRVEPNTVFASVLAGFFAGNPDEGTLALLGAQA